MKFPLQDGGFFGNGLEANSFNGQHKSQKTFFQNMLSNVLV